jgi:hypothetical protein
MHQFHLFQQVTRHLAKFFQVGLGLIQTIILTLTAILIFWLDLAGFTRINQGTVGRAASPARTPLRAASWNERVQVYHAPSPSTRLVPVRKDRSISVPLWLKPALDGKNGPADGFELGSFFWTLMHFHWLFCGKIGFVS